LTRPWRTSSYSDTARQCVEVASAAAACLVRDTRDRDGQQLAFGARAWATFTSRVKDGRLSAG
jgi:hypothetical protein